MFDISLKSLNDCGAHEVLLPDDGVVHQDLAGRPQCDQPEVSPGLLRVPVITSGIMTKLGQVLPSLPSHLPQ